MVVLGRGLHLRIVTLSSLLMAITNPVWAGVGITLQVGDQLQRPIIAEHVNSMEFGSRKLEGTTTGAISKSRLEQAVATNEGPGNSTRPRVFRVGPGRHFKTPSQVAKVAKHGAIVEIDAGIYRGDVAVWRKDDLTLRGVGGRAHLVADGAHANGKAIWVIRGRNTLVENIEFSGAAVPHRNGAGIRLDKGGLTIRGCYFHDNENGLLAAADPSSDIVIENSEFARNGYGDGQTHNIYVNNVRSFTLRNSYVHHAKVGHNVKSRAQRNYILYNRLSDEADGTSSYIVDVPNGGITFMVGNIIQQSRNSPNRTLVSFGNIKRDPHPASVLYVANNTFVNLKSTKGAFVWNRRNLPAYLANNLFVGNGVLLKGDGRLFMNLHTDKPGFRDSENFDYHLTKESPAIDAGGRPDETASELLIPTREYVHPANARERLISGPIDLGAFEYRSP